MLRPNFFHFTYSQKKRKEKKALLSQNTSKLQVLKDIFLCSSRQMERRPSSSSSTSCAPWRTSPGLARPLKSVFSSVLTLDAVSSLNMEAAVGTPTTSRPWRLVWRVVWSQVSQTLMHYIDKHFFYLSLIYFSISVDDELHPNTVNTINTYLR